MKHWLPWKQKCFNSASLVAEIFIHILFCIISNFEILGIWTITYNVLVWFLHFTKSYAVQLITKNGKRDMLQRIFMIMQMSLFVYGDKIYSL